jgi:hypothetical protein
LLALVEPLVKSRSIVETTLVCWWDEKEHERGREKEWVTRKEEPPGQREWSPSIWSVL